MNTIGKIASLTFGAVTGGMFGFLLSNLILNENKKEEERIKKETLEHLKNVTEEYKSGEKITYILDDEEVTKEEYEKYMGKIIDDEKAVIVNEEELKKFRTPKKPVDYHGVSSSSDISGVSDKALDGTNMVKESEQNMAPYIISLEEFEQEGNNRAVTTTYYEGDKTLADMNGVKVENPEEMVGPNALSSFGTLSKDPDIVYVRNNQIGLDIEVCRLKGKYDVEVLGLSNKSKVTSVKPKTKERVVERPRRSSRKEVEDDDEIEEK